MPRWILGMWAVIAVMVGLSALTYTWSKCGAKTLLLGDRALIAAATGMCD